MEVRALCVLCTYCECVASLAYTDLWTLSMTSLFVSYFLLHLSSLPIPSFLPPTPPLPLPLPLQLDMATRGTLCIQEVHPSISPKHSCLRVLARQQTLYASCGSSEDLQKWLRQ